MDHGLPATSNLLVTAEGYRQLAAAFDDPSFVFTPAMFKIVTAGMGTDLENIFRPARSLDGGGSNGQQTSRSPAAQFIPCMPLANAAIIARVPYSSLPGTAPIASPPHPATGDLVVDRGQGDSDEDVQNSKVKGAERKTRGWMAIGRTRDLGQDAPPRDLDIRILGDLPITLDELAAFFPMHYPWHAFVLRFATAGWGSKAISRLIHHYRGNVDEKAIHNFRSTLAHQLKKAKDAVTNNNASARGTSDGEAFTEEAHAASATATSTSSASYSTGSWTPFRSSSRAWKKDLIRDVSLVDLSKGLQNWPTGLGRRHLTIAVERALQLNEGDVMLSTVRAHISLHNLGQELLAIDAKGDPDKAALLRLTTIVDPRAVNQGRSLSIYS